MMVCFTFYRGHMALLVGELGKANADGHENHPLNAVSLRDLVFSLPLDPLAFLPHVMVYLT